MSSSIIFSRAPFRLSLGGGSTDIPSYYEKYGGFIFAAALNLYFDAVLRRIYFDDRIHFRYSHTEVVDSWKELKHEIGRKAFELTGVDGGLDVAFTAEALSKTGLGSSGSFTICLLNALYRLKGKCLGRQALAEKAFEITQQLGWSDGKQDPYVAAFGGFIVLEISQDGCVEVLNPVIEQSTIDLFLENTLFLYTGQRREGSSGEILMEQSEKRVLELKHETKRIGREILSAFESGNLCQFGRLMDEHWQIKRVMSDKISNERFDAIYKLAKENGALGGKLIGAGGGGYFIFYCGDESIKKRISFILIKEGLREIPLGIDYLGARVKKIDF